VGERERGRKQIAHRGNTVFRTEREVLTVVVPMRGVTRGDFGQIFRSVSYRVF